jgi:hypothetical protein
MASSSSSILDAQEILRNSDGFLTSDLRDFYQPLIHDFQLSKIPRPSKDLLEKVNTLNRKLKDNTFFLNFFTLETESFPRKLHAFAKTLMRIDKEKELYKTNPPIVKAISNLFSIKLSSESSGKINSKILDLIQRRLEERLAAQRKQSIVNKRNDYVAPIFPPTRSAKELEREAAATRIARTIRNKSLINWRIRNFIGRRAANRITKAGLQYITKFREKRNTIQGASFAIKLKKSYAVGNLLSVGEWSLPVRAFNGAMIQFNLPFFAHQHIIAATHEGRLLDFFVEMAPNFHLANTELDETDETIKLILNRVNKEHILEHEMVLINALAKAYDKIMDFLEANKKINLIKVMIKFHEKFFDERSTPVSNDKEYLMKAVEVNDEDKATNFTRLVDTTITHTKYESSMSVTDIGSSFAIDALHLQESMQDFIGYALKIIGDSIERRMDFSYLSWLYTTKMDVIIFEGHRVNASGSSYVNLPRQINNKKCCINPQNEDNRCFYYAWLAHCAYKSDKIDLRNLSRVSNLLKMENFLEKPLKIRSYPVSLGQINTIEKDNKGWFFDIFEIADSADPINSIFISRAASKKDRKEAYRSGKLVTLLLHEGHFSYIKNQKALLSDNGSVFHCPICYQRFTSFKSQKEWDDSGHVEKCTGIPTIAKEIFEMPKPGKNLLEFSSFHHIAKQPISIYADFEATQDPETGKQTAKSGNFQIVTQPGVVLEPGIITDWTYEGEDCAAKMLLELNRVEPLLKRSTNRYEKLNIANFSQADLSKFEESTNCFVCGVEFKNKNKWVYDPSDDYPEELVQEVEGTNENISEDEEYIFPNLQATPKLTKKEIYEKLDKKERLGMRKSFHHCHATNAFGGAACCSCNLKIRKQTKFVVLFHNGVGYDFHHLILGLVNPEVLEVIDVQKIRIKTILVNSEKNKTLDFGGIKFRDSFAFLAKSLDELSKSVSDDLKNNIRKIAEEFECQDPSISATISFDLLNSKMYFPYEVDWELRKDISDLRLEDFKQKLNSHNILKNEKGTKKEEIERKYPRDFYNKDGTFTTKPFDKLKQTISHFKLKKWNELVKLYVRTDVAHLADVFENFRNLALKDYGLDPLYYLGLPGLAWSAALKKNQTGAVELLTCEKMYEMFEKGKRGGLSVAKHRFLESGLKEDGNQTFIDYYDATNLYGLPMMGYLPHSNFQWVKDENLNMIYFSKFEEGKGALLEVDLEYPKHLHDEHNDFPLAPENLIQSRHDPSKWSSPDPEKKNELSRQKLIANLHDKDRYVLHIDNLKYYLSKGLKLKKIHRAIEFTEKKWLADYIIFNSNERKKYTNDCFERDFYKLLNNAVFGKTMEDIRHHTSAHFVYNKPQLFRSKVASPHFKSANLIGDEFAVVIMTKTKYLLNKPIFAGQKILDASKLVIAKHWHDVLIPTFGYENIRLGMSDTDSLLYEVRCKSEQDYILKMKSIEDHLDNSILPKDHPLRNLHNKGVVGKMKREQIYIPAAVCLRPKTHCIQAVDDKLKIITERKAKGCPKPVSKSLGIDEYKSVLETGKPLKAQYYKMGSVKHSISVALKESVVLSRNDNKSYYDPQENITPISWGHYKLNP